MYDYREEAGVTQDLGKDPTLVSIQVYLNITVFDI